MSDIAKMIAIAKKFGGSSPSAPAEVVILPETEIPYSAEKDSYLITRPLSATPTAGATAKINYNGVEYPCTVAFFRDEDNSLYAMGNFNVIALPGAGGNPDAPFVVLLVPDGTDGAYGSVMPLDGANPITLSIVQVGGASGGESSGGGVFIVNCPTFDIADGAVTFDKTFAEVAAAYNAGQYVVFRANLGGVEISLPMVFFTQVDGIHNVIGAQGVIDTSLIGLNMLESGEGSCQSIPLNV